MSAFYSVIKYIPDPIADESINIGVIVYDEKTIDFKFINNFNRVKLFGKESITYIKEFITEFGNNQADLFIENNNLKADNLLPHWKNSIQFTEARASLKNVDDLSAEIIALYLKDITTKKKIFRKNKEYILNSTHKSLKTNLVDKFGNDAANLLKKKYTLEGSIDEHEFDIAIANGAPYLGAFTLSFCNDNQALRSSVDAAAFAFEDIKKLQRKLPLALVTVPPNEKNRAFERAINIFNQLKVPLIKESEMNSWAKSVVDNLPQKISH